MKQITPTWISIFLILLLAAITNNTLAQSPFRQEFIMYYKGLNFKPLVELVKKNKDIIPDEVKSIILEAMAEGKDFGERVYFLDIAQAMATMHKYWNNGDERLIKDVEALQEKEIHKEQERIAELTKWESEEKFLGNLVMDKHLEEMEREGLSPVVYPHWAHRIWFKCKVCHDEIFVMKRWVNRISQKKIIEGKQCGVCHNGAIAFGANEKCERCHIALKPESEKLHDLDKIDHKHIKEVAERFGAEWNIENLPEGGIPVDRFRFINWVELKNKKVFNPIVSLDKDFKDEIRDNIILFETKGTSMKYVVFSHKVHSIWIKCSSCHPAIFKEELGGNPVRMLEMSKGRNCGHCHGKVSFSFAECLRCHVQPQDEPVNDALIRSQEPSSVATKP